jgi:hypothetical protein
LLPHPGVCQPPQTMADVWVPFVLKILLILQFTLGAKQNRLFQHKTLKNQQVLKWNACRFISSFSPLFSPPPLLFFGECQKSKLLMPKLEIACSKKHQKLVFYNSFLFSLHLSVTELRISWFLFHLGVCFFGLAPPRKWCHDHDLKLNLRVPHSKQLLNNIFHQTLCKKKFFCSKDCGFIELFARAHVGRKCLCCKNVTTAPKPHELNLN